MNEDWMNQNPFAQLGPAPTDPPLNPNQDAIRRMMAEMLASKYEPPRPDGSVGSRSFMEAIGSAQAPAGTQMPMPSYPPEMMQDGRLKARPDTSVPGVTMYLPQQPQAIRKPMR